MKIKSQDNNYRVTHLKIDNYRPIFLINTDGNILINMLAKNTTYIKYTGDQ